MQAGRNLAALILALALLAGCVQQATATAPTVPEPTATARPDRLYICNDAMHVEMITSYGKVRILVVCNE